MKRSLTGVSSSSGSPAGLLVTAVSSGCLPGKLKCPGSTPISTRTTLTRQCTRERGPQDHWTPHCLSAGCHPQIEKPARPAASVRAWAFVKPSPGSDNQEVITKPSPQPHLCLQLVGTTSVFEHQAAELQTVVEGALQSLCWHLVHKRPKARHVPTCFYCPFLLCSPLFLDIPVHSACPQGA